MVAPGVFAVTWNGMAPTSNEVDAVPAPLSGRSSTRNVWIGTLSWVTNLEPRTCQHLTKPGITCTTARRRMPAAWLAGQGLRPVGAHDATQGLLSASGDHESASPEPS